MINLCDALGTDSKNCPEFLARAKKQLLITLSPHLVHGNCVSIGCYAMTNARIEEIYCLVVAALGQGQPFFRVHIFPFRMTGQHLARQRNYRWYEFWQNLKEGYDFFEENGYNPPDVGVSNRRYVFHPVRGTEGY